MMNNYKGFDYSYDELFEEYVVYDENGIPLSCWFKTEDEVIETIDRWMNK